MAGYSGIQRLPRRLQAPRTSLPGWLRRLFGNPLAVAGLVVIGTLVFIAVFAPLLAPHDPDAQDCAAGALKGSSGDHLLGTDATCRDVLSRLMYGARVSLAVGILSQVAILGVALAIGATAAMAGRFADNVLMRFTDLVYAFPDLLAIILLRQALLDKDVPGGSLTVVVVAIAAVGWTTAARVLRGQMLSLKDRDFVLAARASGAGSFRIAFVHLLPNAAGPLIVVLTFGVPLAIFAESALSFIGAGIEPPTATWGTMVDAGYQSVFARPMLALYPAFAISLTMLAFTFLGNGLRDALSPRAR